MAGLTAAIIGSAVIGAGASVASAASAKNAVKKSTDQAVAEQQAARAQNAATLAPYVGTGNRATPAIEALLGLGGDPSAQNAAFENWRNSTGYQFAQQEGQKGLNAALGRAGQLESGAAVKAALKFNQNLANSSFGNYLGALQGQQNVGLSAANAQAGVTTNAANAISGLHANQGETNANAALATGGQINSALGGAVGALSLNNALKSSYGQGGGIPAAPVLGKYSGTSHVINQPLRLPSGFSW